MKPSQCCHAIDEEAVERCAEGIAAVRERGGRLFILGVGGSAGHASHAVNDFRKICGVEAYAPTDNVSELTARTNDEGWDTTFSEWLHGLAADRRDGILVFSVGVATRAGGLGEYGARHRTRAGAGRAVFGVVGRDGGFTAKRPTACVIAAPLFPTTSRRSPRVSAR